MAFLTRVHANGATYLYLREYATRRNVINNSVTIYRFGRIDNALKKMHKWKQDINKFPEQLKRRGFEKEDLKAWIKRVERMQAEIYVNS